MDKICYLVKQADEALLDSQKLLNDEDLFGSIRGVVLSNYEQVWDEIFGKTNTEKNKELLR